MKLAEKAVTVQSSGSEVRIIFHVMDDMAAVLLRQMIVDDLAKGHLEISLDIDNPRLTETIS